MQLSRRMKSKEKQKRDHKVSQPGKAKTTSTRLYNPFLFFVYFFSIVYILPCSSFPPPPCLPFFPPSAPPYFPPLDSEGPLFLFFFFKLVYGGMSYCLFRSPLFSSSSSFLLLTPQCSMMFSLVLLCEDLPALAGVIG